MAKITDKTVKSKYPPKDTNVTWIDTSVKPAVTKSYINGTWIVVGGGSSGIDITSDTTALTETQKHNAQANINDTAANTTTGKMGYKVLDGSKSFASQVTTENTIYEIRDVFDLGGTQETPVSVTLPTESKIKFDGGMIKNCTIIGNNTSIDAGNEQIFENVEFSGNFYGALNALWIGAKQEDSTFDNSIVLQKYFDSYTAYFNTIKFPEGSYYFKTPVEVSTRFIKIDGDNSIFYTLIDDDLSGNGQVFLTISQESFILDNVRIYNARKTGIYDISKTIAVKCSSNSQLFSFNNITIYYFDIAIYLTDVWYGDFSGRVVLSYNRIGIFGLPVSSREINTIDFSNVRLSGCSKDAAKVLYPKQNGESDDDWNMRWARCGVDFHCTTSGCKFNGMVIEGFDYGIRFNNKSSESDVSLSGLINIYNCYFEGNQIYDIYVGIGYIINPTGHSVIFKNTVSITQCLFHILKKVYLKDCISTILSNHEPIELTLTGVNSTSYTIYDNSVDNIVRVSNSVIKCLLLKTPQTIPSYLGNTYQSTLSQCIKSIESGMQSLVPNILTTTGFNDNLDSRHGINRNIPFIASLTRMPRLIDNHLIKANEISGDGTTFKSSTDSGNTKINVSVSNINGNIYNQVSLDSNAIEIEEFIRMWKAGTAYTGYVKQIFNVKVITDPSNGLVYNENNTVIGFGKKAIDDGFTFPNAKYFINVDTLCSVFYAYGVVTFDCDLVQNCRSYEEVLRGIDSSSAGYGKARFICTTTQRDSASLIKHINKIIYNTTDEEYQIWDGTKWNTLSNPWTRYKYNECGKSISEKALIADLSGQTFFNYATGIRYTFYVDLIANTHHWITSIGSVESLEHPNGYDATSNPIEYATELTTGEMVMYNGNIVKWDGTQFVNLDGTALN